MKLGFTIFNENYKENLDLYNKVIISFLKRLGYSDNDVLSIPYVRIPIYSPSELENKIRKYEENKRVPVSELDEYISSVKQLNEPITTVQDINYILQRSNLLEYFKRVEGLDIVIIFLLGMKHIDLRVPEGEEGKIARKRGFQYASTLFYPKVNPNWPYVILISVENTTIPVKNYINLLKHEIGEILGLDHHTDGRKCVMTPKFELNPYSKFCKDCSRKLSEYELPSFIKESLTLE